jgi:hypothetical protein
MPFVKMIVPSPGEVIRIDTHVKDLWLSPGSQILQKFTIINESKYPITFVDTAFTPLEPQTLRQFWWEYDHWEVIH